MKKFLLAAAFVTVCSFSSALAQTAIQSAPQTEKAAIVKDAPQSDVKEKPASAKAASCCSKKEAKACSDKKETKTAAGKSSCCQKGHTEAKAEDKKDAATKQ